ncbi:kinase-like domain-containing protein [Coniochaeta sp. 2T2.1]|nr:kinase-like domain-containing protein [Coniochaeta sp. 2T2.1]
MLCPDTQGICTAEKLMAIKHHPNIVEYTDWCPIPRLFIRAYLDGRPIQRSDFPFPRHVLLLAHDMLHALRHLHKYQVVHANIKPANIFLLPLPSSPSPSNPKQQPQPIFKLTDFALTAEDDSILPRLRSGGNCYLAPEVLRNGNKMNYPSKTVEQLYPPKTDVWALGIVVLEMFLRRSPGEWKHPSEDYVKAVEMKRRQARNSGMGGVLRTVVDGMLEPVQRVRSTAGRLVEILPARKDISVGVDVLCGRD